jgi:mono/diheme cytochrome c family protein
MRMKTALPAFLLAAALVACENVDKDMHQQVTFRHQKAPFIPAPKGSKPVNAPRVDYSSVDPVTLTSPVATNQQTGEEGRKLYDIFCIACHGQDGSTNATPVADKYEPRPANLKNEAALSLTEGDIFVKIVNEQMGIMPSYRYELSDAEAWMVVAHVIKLQGRK